MKKSFIRYILFLLYLEILFHIACFNSISFTSLLIIFFMSIITSGIYTIIMSFIKNQKLNKTIEYISFGCLVALLIAELVYYRIYDSFFTFNGIQFAGAIIGGYDKILKTIFNNIPYILLLVIPTFIFMKTHQVINKNKLDLSIICFFIMISSSYLLVFFNYYNKTSDDSYYALINLKNLPIQNVKKMGFMASASLSLTRKLFGFNPILKQNEDILNNKRTYLMDESNKEYNIDKNIDFSRLINEEGNGTINYLHNYFSSQEPTEKNEFTGIFQEKNAIFILAESFDEIAIDENLTPTLYKLKNEGIVFNNYFSPKYPASTADGEYMLEWGILPIIGENYSLIDMVYNTNPYLLPRVLKKYDYKTYVYHDYFGYYNRRDEYFDYLNFDKHRYCNDGIDMKCEFFHGSDIDMMNQTIDDYISQDRFYTYYITLSGHGSYDSSNFVAEKHINNLWDLPYSYQIKYYLAANIDFDLAMNELITKLENANKLDDTVIVISSDHSPYYLSDEELNSRSSISRNNKFDQNRGSLIIYNSAYKKQTIIDKYAMNIDVLPTVLNMLNIPYDSRLIIGKDIMAPNNEGVVILPDRSWINQKGSYDTASSYFNPFEDNIDDKYITKITNEVNEKYDVSVSMQYQDYYSYIFR